MCCRDTVSPRSVVTPFRLLLSLDCARCFSNRPYAHPLHVDMDRVTLECIVFLPAPCAALIVAQERADNAGHGPCVDLTLGYYQHHNDGDTRTGGIDTLQLRHAGGGSGTADARGDAPADHGAPGKSPSYCPLEGGGVFDLVVPSRSRGSSSEVMASSILAVCTDNCVRWWPRQPASPGTSVVQFAVGSASQTGGMLTSAAPLTDAVACTYQGGMASLHPWLPDGTTALLSGDDDDPHRRTLWRAHNYDAWCVREVPLSGSARSLLATGGDDGRLCLWDRRSQLHDLRPSQQTVLTAGVTSVVPVHRAATGGWQPSEEDDSMPSAGSQEADSCYVCATSYGGEVAIYDTRRFKCPVSQLPCCRESGVWRLRHVPCSGGVWVAAGMQSGAAVVDMRDATAPSWPSPLSFHHTSHRTEEGEGGSLLNSHDTATGDCPLLVYDAAAFGFAAASTDDEGSFYVVTTDFYAKELRRWRVDLGGRPSR